MDMAQSIASLLIGGGLLAFIQFLINRHDSKHDRFKEVLEAIRKVDSRVGKLEELIDEREATLARTHILRFRDELYNDTKHSAEYFEQTLDDIKTYNTFCDTHKRFANGRTTEAARYITEEYHRLFKEHKL